MSWSPRSSPILCLLLGVLLAGELGWKVFVDANAIECNYEWLLPPDSGVDGQLCQVTKKGGPGYDRYACSWCGRWDKQPPSANDCAGPHGPLASSGSLSCNSGMEEDISNLARPILCKHREPGDIPIDYHCAKRHLNQQCPKDNCKLVPWT